LGSVLCAPRGRFRRHRRQPGTGRRLTRLAHGIRRARQPQHAHDRATHRRRQSMPQGAPLPAIAIPMPVASLGTRFADTQPNAPPALHRQPHAASLTPRASLTRHAHAASDRTPVAQAGALCSRSRLRAHARRKRAHARRGRSPLAHPSAPARLSSRVSMSSPCAATAYAGRIDNAVIVDTRKPLGGLGLHDSFASR